MLEDVTIFKAQAWNLQISFTGHNKSQSRIAQLIHRMNFRWDDAIRRAQILN